MPAVAEEEEREAPVRVRAVVTGRALFLLSIKEVRRDLRRKEEEGERDQEKTRIRRGKSEGMGHSPTLLLYLRIITDSEIVHETNVKT